MSTETITRCVSELLEAYPGAQRADDGGRVLVRLMEVRLPEGCVPARTAALVVLDPGQPKPRLLVRDKPRTPGGVNPRNVSPEIVGGETWYSFSYNVAWEESKHTALQFVESALRRFAKNE
jgi:hypothetical protein